MAIPAGGSDGILIPFWNWHMGFPSSFIWKCILWSLMLPEWKFPCSLLGSKQETTGIWVWEGDGTFQHDAMKSFYMRFQEFPYSWHKWSFGWDGMFIANDNYPPHHLIKWGFIVVFFLVVLSVLVGSWSPDEVCSDSDFYFHDWAVLDLSNFLLKWYLLKV